MPPRTAIYVDGFNLYYAIRNSGNKWLDLNALALTLLPGSNISLIKYFTANVVARSADPNQAIRQQTYLRALATIPHLQIIKGHFLTKPTRLPLAKCLPFHVHSVEVMRTEEKGSDVNLASHLIVDAYKAAFDEAWVLSNDSDLCYPIQVVKTDLGLRVRNMNPHHYQKRSRALGKIIGATDFIQITFAHLGSSQFPPALTDAHGAFMKPTTW